MNIIVAIIVRLKRAPESRMHQNAPFRRRTCQILFCGGGTAHCPGPTPTGEGPSPDPTHVGAAAFDCLQHLTSRPHFWIRACHQRPDFTAKNATNSILAVVLPPTLLEELTQGRHLTGATALFPPSKAKQKIISSAKLPHTRRHILARRLPCDVIVCPYSLYAQVYYRPVTPI